MPFDSFERNYGDATRASATRSDAGRVTALHSPRRAIAGRRAFLPRRASLILDDWEGTIVTVESGCLWLTMEHDPRDVVLVAGMRFEIDRSGRTIVAAEEDSRFCLTHVPSAASLLVARIRQRLARVFEPSSTPRRWVPYY